MRRVSDIADWWDKQAAETRSYLTEYVRKHPDFFAITTAGFLDTAMTIGSGYVDILRLGEGIEEGGWGWGKDALRLVGLAGPIGRGAKQVASFRATTLARLIDDPGGPRCAFVAAAKALHQTSQKTEFGRHYAAVDDVADALGLSRARQAGSLLEN